MTGDQIDRVRCFHRLVTQRAGALDDHFLGRNRPLGESRVLFEIGPQGADLRDLRSRLGLDSGYLSRLVQSLSSAVLTPSGLAEFDEMNRRSDEVAEGILAPLTDGQRERLVAGMTEVHRLLR